MGFMVIVESGSTRDHILNTDHVISVEPWGNDGRIAFKLTGDRTIVTKMALLEALKELEGRSQK